MLCIGKLWTAVDGGTAPSQQSQTRGLPAPGPGLSFTRQQSDKLEPGVLFSNRK